jgi:hypothetical protein
MNHQARAAGNLERRIHDAERNLFAAVGADVDEFFLDLAQTGLRVRVLSHGRGPAVVLLHGAPRGRRSPRLASEVLCAGRRLEVDHEAGAQIWGRSGRPRAGGRQRSLAWFLAGPPDLCRRFGPASSAKNESGFRLALACVPARPRRWHGAQGGPGPRQREWDEAGSSTPESLPGRDRGTRGTRLSGAGLGSCSPRPALAWSRDRNPRPAAVARSPAGSPWLAGPALVL